MQMLKILLATLLSLNLVACGGNGVVGEVCKRSQECLEAEWDVEFVPDSTNACVQEFDMATADFSQEELESIYTALELCLTEAQCEDFEICLETYL
jgi:hypothetical protein